MSRPPDRLERLVARTRADLREWTEAPGHDPGILLLELFAMLGETLLAYADAIGEESVLGSASRRRGVRVSVDGERWRRVESLAESGPDDPHYVITRTEDGATAVEFGDGVHGRRPPRGAAMRISYRTGAGRYAAVTLQESRVLLDLDWNDDEDEDD